MRTASLPLVAKLNRMHGDDSLVTNKSAIKFNSSAIYRASDSGNNLI